MSQVPNRVDDLGTLFKNGDEIGATETTNPHGPKMHEFKLIRKNINDACKLDYNGQVNIPIKDELMRKLIIENGMNIKF